MKLTIDQLKGLGYVETRPGHWHKGNELVLGSADNPQPLPKPAKRRIRQSSKPVLNKLEQEWFDVLLVRYPSHAKAIRPQTIRFKLGNGIWYKPDIWCPTLGTWGCCWEVKGPHSFRGGFENLKVAASLYPEIKWVLVWKDKGWQEQEVLP